jgi:HD superfamily phosphodiesterase
MAINYYRESGSHGTEHVLRVYGYSQRLLAATPSARADVVGIAALLHDVGRGADGDHAVCGAIVAERILGATMPELEDATKAAVVECILSHSERSRCCKLEAQILWDADKLDILGPCGILRIAMRAGELGASFGHVVDPAEGSLLAELVVKRDRLVPETFLTGAGRSIAAPLHGFVCDFIGAMPNT